MAARIKWIDVLKGFGICLVLLGHCISRMAQPLNTLILSFHMPLFFFASGLTFYFKLAAEKTSESLFSYTKRKLYTLIVPQIVLGVLNVVSAVAIDCFVFKSVSLGEIDYVGSFLVWFLPVLFLIDISLWLLVKYIKRYTLYIVFLALTLTAFLLIKSSVLIIEQYFGGLLFALLGLLAYPLLQKYEEKVKYKGLVFLFGLSVTVVLSTLNDPIGMYANLYGNKLLFIVTAIAGILAFADLSMTCQNIGSIVWLGGNTINIYVTHFAVRKCLALAFAFVGLSIEAEPFFLAGFAILLLIEIPVVLVTNRFFPYLFGKKRLHSSKTSARWKRGY